MSDDSDTSDDDMFGGLGGGGLLDVADQESDDDEANKSPPELDPFQKLFVREAAANDHAANDAETEAALGDHEYKALCGLSSGDDAADAAALEGGPSCDADADDSAARDLSDLAAWIEASGGYVHPRLRMAPFKDSGVGGYLERDPTTGGGSDGTCAAGELLIRVPAECVMFADAESTAGLQGAGGHALGDLKQVLLVLALALRAELQLGAQSSFAPYLHTLPSSLASFPVLWPRRELQLLCDASPAARQQLTAQAAALRKEHAHVGKCLHRAQHNAGDGHGWGDDDACEFDWGCSLRDFMVAKLLVCSRCFGIGAKGDVALLPMVDMLNHSATPHVSLGKATADGGTAAPGPAPGPSPFVTAAAFQGARPGCTFGTGPRGLGYYEDGGGQSAAAHAAAEGAARGSQGAGFTLTLARAAVDGEELFSTYDTAGTRADISWLLNYGFVPADSAGARAAADADARIEAHAAAGSSTPLRPAVSSFVTAAASKLAAAAAALEACGPHTHGAVRLLQRERVGLLAAAVEAL